MKTKPTPTKDTSRETRLQTGPALSPAEKALVADLVADGLAIQDKFRPDPVYSKRGKVKRDKE